MQITRTAPTEITIIGNIKSTADYLDIRKMVMDAVDDGAKSLTLRVQESLSMPSSVIGFFVKLVNRDKVPVTMLIQDARLLELLEELGLAGTFGARHEA
jgi:hypothetical protein